MDKKIVSLEEYYFDKLIARYNELLSSAPRYRRRHIRISLKEAKRLKKQAHKELSAQINHGR